MKIKYSVGEYAEINVWEWEHSEFPNDGALRRKAEKLVRNKYEDIDSDEEFYVFFLHPSRGWLYFCVTAEIVLELEAWTGDITQEVEEIIDELNNQVTE